MAFPQPTRLVDVLFSVEKFGKIILAMKDKNFHRMMFSVWKHSVPISSSKKTPDIQCVKASDARNSFNYKYVNVTSSSIVIFNPSWWLNPVCFFEGWSKMSPLIRQSSTHRGGGLLLASFRVSSFYPPPSPKKGRRKKKKRGKRTWPAVSWGLSRISRHCVVALGIFW